ncbi:MAG TPA: O-antigen ligase family protein [Solirubrobacteraceae bacterium]
MRGITLTAARALALAGPTALAFFAGGYFSEARSWAGAGAWLGVLLAAAGAARLPRSRPARLALAGLSLLAAWTLLSILWAPIAGNAYHAGQITVLYLGALLGGAMLFRGGSMRLLEPSLAAGTLLVIGYGLSERLLPGVLHFSASISANGRLEQPLTYWNAMGELAAIGFVLCARLAGDPGRHRALRAVAAGATAPLGLGLYISFSRGALFACVAGLVALVVLAARREQLGAVARSVIGAALAVAAAAPFAGVTSLAGALSERETQGAVVLVALLVITALAAGGQLLTGRRERVGELRLPQHAPWLAGVVICAGLALAIVLGAHESAHGTARLPGGAVRLTTLQSNRYDYWSVALRAFGSEPLHGVGAGGWSVDWLRWRHVSEAAQDAHSLPLQTLAELGVVGFLFLLALIIGIAGAAARAVSGMRAVVGPVAALVVYLAHAPLDWDWQMPAVTLVAMVIAGAVLGQAEAEPAAADAAVARATTEPPRYAEPRA